MRRSGNGSSSRAAAALSAVTGPISTKRVRRASAPGRRRVTSHAACEAKACAGWASSSPKASAAARKRSRKPRGRITSSSTISSQSASSERRGGERGVDVGPLAGARRGGDEVQGDGVARARELAAQARDRAQMLGADDADDVHAPARQAAGRADERHPPRGRRAPPRGRPSPRPRAARGARACPSGRRGSPGRPRWAARARDRAPPRAGRRSARSSSRRRRSGGGRCATRSRSASAAPRRSEGAWPRKTP